MSVKEQCPTIAELMASPLAKYITLAANDCGYGGTTEELIVNYVCVIRIRFSRGVSDGIITPYTLPLAT